MDLIGYFFHLLRVSGDDLLGLMITGRKKVTYRELIENNPLRLFRFLFVNFRNSKTADRTDLDLYTFVSTRCDPQVS